MKPLEADLRRLLHPNTAQRLKVRQARSSLQVHVLLAHLLVFGSPGCGSMPQSQAFAAGLCRDG